ncbi:hypothetical protein ACS0TY_031369 [Phlomoides rotata]
MTDEIQSYCVLHGSRMLVVCSRLWLHLARCWMVVRCDSPPLVGVVDLVSIMIATTTYPYEDEVPELVDDGNDVVEPIDNFIDQVESSHAWTTMRDNLEMQMFADYM